MEREIYQYFCIGFTGRTIIKDGQQIPEPHIVYLCEPVWIIPFAKVEVLNRTERETIQTLLFCTEHRN